MYHFRFYPCLVISLLVLTGCAQTYTWTKLGATQTEYYRASSYCQALASGATPMDYSNSGTSTTYHSGTVYGSGGNSATYSGTSTTYNNNTGQALANLGQGIRRQNLFNDCMRGQGFTPVSEAAAQNRATAAPLARNSYVKNIETWDEKRADFGKAKTALDETKLLSKPSFSGSLIDIVPKNTDVRILSIAAETWLRVSTGGEEGYIARSWAKDFSGEPLTFEAAEERIDKRQVSDVEAQNVETARVIWDNVSVFSQPDFESPTLRGLTKGHKVIVLETLDDEWVRVQFGDVQGFASKNGLSID